MLRMTPRVDDNKTFRRKHVVEETSRCHFFRLCYQFGQVGSLSSVIKSSQIYSTRNGDYEGYLASLLLPGTPLKKTALTVRAINLELSQILDLTRNTVAAQGRFLFWNDMIERAYKSDKDGLSQTHPVVAELSTVNARDLIHDDSNCDSNWFSCSVYGYTIFRNAILKNWSKRVLPWLTVMTCLLIHWRISSSTLTDLFYRSIHL